MCLNGVALIMTDNINADEDALWQRLTAQLKPLAKKPYVPYAPPTKIVIKRHSLPDSPLAVPQKPASHWHNLHRREQKRLSRGSQTPQAILDLHGHTLAAAHTQLQAFVRQAVQAQHRLVLVITGKGNVGDGGGVLRRALPLWLHDAALSPFIIGFRAASGKHGGNGAFYVVLRTKG
jgi:DNA-nicking Smr family endonuclease